MPGFAFMIENFSLVIPLFNEEENIERVIEELCLELNKLIINYEIILIDDGSTDNTVSKVQKLLQKLNIDLQIIRNSINRGQSYSINKGIISSKYKSIVTLDGDGQNDPKDIKHLINVYNPKQNIHLVSGIRTKRRDSYVKKLSSLIANEIRKRYLNDSCSDTGCALKIFNKEIYENLIYFNGIHRFLPALFLSKNSKNIYIPVNHRNRTKGKSKYGISNRLINGLFDMYKVKKMMKINKATTYNRNES